MPYPKLVQLSPVPVVLLSRKEAKPKHNIAKYGVIRRCVFVLMCNHEMAQLAFTKQHCVATYVMPTMQLLH